MSSDMVIPAPHLELQRTVSNPIDDTEVIGFIGRDSHFGRDAHIYKAGKIPKTASRVGLPGYRDGGPNSVYILGNEKVYSIKGAAASCAPLHTFSDADWEHGRVTVPALKWDYFETWERDEVEVTN